MSSSGQTPDLTKCNCCNTPKCTCKIDLCKCTCKTTEGSKCIVSCKCKFGCCTSECNCKDKCTCTLSQCCACTDPDCQCQEVQCEHDYECACIDCACTTGLCECTIKEESASALTQNNCCNQSKRIYKSAISKHTCKATECCKCNFTSCKCKFGFCRAGCKCGDSSTCTVGTGCAHNCTNVKFQCKEGDCKCTDNCVCINCQCMTGLCQSTKNDELVYNLTKYDCNKDEKCVCKPGLCNCICTTSEGSKCNSTSCTESCKCQSGCCSSGCKCGDNCTAKDEPSSKITKCSCCKEGKCDYQPGLCKCSCNSTFCAESCKCQSGCCSSGCKCRDNCTVKDEPSSKLTKCNCCKEGKCDCEPGLCKCACKSTSCSESCKCQSGCCSSGCKCGDICTTKNEPSSKLTKCNCCKEGKCDCEPGLCKCSCNSTFCAESCKCQSGCCSSGCKCGDNCTVKDEPSSKLTKCNCCKEGKCDCEPGLCKCTCNSTSCAESCKCKPQCSASGCNCIQVKDQYKGPCYTCCDKCLGIACKCTNICKGTDKEEITHVRA